MLTILCQNGFEVAIPVDDHPPAHVHVRKAGRELVVNLGRDGGRPSVRRNRGMNRSDLAKAIQVVHQHQTKLWKAWRQYHGQD